MKARVIKISKEEFKRLLEQVTKIPSATNSPYCDKKNCDGKLRPISFNCSKTINFECEKCNSLYCCEETLQKAFDKICLTSIRQDKKIAKLRLAS